jgi:hypothetical protein
MNLFRTLNGAALLALSGAGFSGCIQAPDYSTTPEIDFKEVQVVHIADPNSPSDELTFVVNFRDGDGDLGLSQDDIKVAPYNQAPTTALAIQRNHANNQYNYYIQPLKRDASGNFVAFNTPSPFGKIGEYDGTYPRLDGTDAKPAPLKGELNYKLPITLDGSIYKIGDVFKFQITILDRALHTSNTVTSSEVRLGQ